MKKTIVTIKLMKALLLHTISEVRLHIFTYSIAYFPVVRKVIWKSSKQSTYVIQQQRAFKIERSFIQSHTCSCSTHW